MAIDKLLNIQDVAQLIGVHPRTVSRAIARGELAVLRLSARVVRVRPADLRDYLHAAGRPDRASD